MKKMILTILAVLLVSEGGSAKSISVNTFAEVDDVESAYDARCASTTTDEEECGALRAQLYVEIEEELTLMQWANIEDNIEPALMALQLPDKDVQLKALLVLGKWSSRPEVQRAVRPFLGDASVSLAYYAARILEHSPDKGAARLAQQFLSNHRPSVFNDTLRLYARSEHPDYAARRLPKYPNSTPLDLADVYKDDVMAAGFSTTDSMAQVLAYYREVTKQKELDQHEFAQKKMLAGQALQDVALNNPKIKEMEALTKKYLETQDPGLLAQLETLGKEISTVVNEASDEALFKLTPPPGHGGDPTFDSGKYFFITTRGGKPVEMILVYADEQLARAVIQLAWTQNK